MTTFVRKQAAVIAAAAMISLLAAPSAAGASPGAGPGAGHSWSHQDVHVCSKSAAGRAACTSIARVLYADGLEYQAGNQSQLDNAARAAASVSYTAVGIRTAYGITGQGDPSRVVAIVDANDDPNAYSHLSTYRSTMGLPLMQSCTLSTLTGLTSSSSSPCFTKVNQTGGTTLPSADPGWSNEIDLDLQAASAICPDCSLLLLEATSASFGDLGTAVTTASNTAHVLAITNSYGTTSDVPGAAYPAWDAAAQKGIAVLASAGDWGYATSFPASATNVLGVGGTTLTVSSTTGARTAETAWSSTGSGCSLYNAAPTWQVIPNSPCGPMKAVSDLSADADPNSGLQVYTTYSGTTGWWIFGGTSLSSPLVAAQYAKQGGYGGSYLAGQYAWATTTPYFDVTSGSNGTCSPSVMCTAGAGWDGPTGLGSFATVTASPVLTTITVSPPSASVATLGTQQFTATGYDQFDKALSPQPTFAWSVTGGGVIASGLFTAGATAGGPYTVTATALSVKGTASVTVTSLPADFTLSVSPTSQSVRQGNTATYTVTITRSNGFSGAVTLSVTGLASAFTATFTPNPATTTSQLKVKTVSGHRGTYTMTIKGVSGSLSHTTTANLRVTR